VDLGCRRSIVRGCGHIDNDGRERVGRVRRYRNEGSRGRAAVGDGNPIGRGGEVDRSRLGIRDGDLVVTATQVYDAADHCGCLCGAACRCEDDRCAGDGVAAAVDDMCVDHVLAGTVGRLVGNVNDKRRRRVCRVRWRIRKGDDPRAAVGNIQTVDGSRKVDRPGFGIGDCDRIIAVAVVHDAADHCRCLRRSAAGGEDDRGADDRVAIGIHDVGVDLGCRRSIVRGCGHIDNDGRERVGRVRRYRNEGSRGRAAVGDGNPIGRGGEVDRSRLGIRDGDLVVTATQVYDAADHCGCLCGAACRCEDDSCAGDGVAAAVHDMRVDHVLARAIGRLVGNVND